MSDFLGRLAARQVGAISGVAPRLQSRFEPATIEDGLAVPEPSARPEHEEKHGPTSNRPAAAPARQQAPALRPPVPVRTSAPEPAATRAGDDRRPREPSKSTRGRSSRTPGKPAEPPRLDRSPAPDGQRGASRRAEPARPDPGTPSAIQVARLEEVEQRPPPPSHVPQRAEPLVPVPEPRPLPVPLASREPRRRAEEPAIVKVTIGRVEVRAVTPPVAPPRRAAVRTAPSLEEYLERRHGVTR